MCQQILVADLVAPTSAPAAPASAAATAAAEDAERKTPKAKAVPTLESSGKLYDSWQGIRKLRIPTTAFLGRGLYIMKSTLVGILH